MPATLEVDTDLLQSAVDSLATMATTLAADNRAIHGARIYASHHSGYGSGAIGSALRLAVERCDELIAAHSTIARSCLSTSDSLAWAAGCFDASELQCTPR